MKWKKEQKFDCETYLQTLAMGLYSPDAEEHVANCNFCRDIYHGGSEEFPLSLKEAADEMRAEKKRKTRRKFLGRLGTAAAAVGLVALGYAVSDTSQSSRPDPVVINRRNAMSTLDSVWSRQGPPGIQSRFARASGSHAVEILEWIADRKYVALYPLVVDALADNRSRASRAAFGILLEMDKPVRDGLAIQIRQIQPQIKESWMIPMVDELLDQ